MTQSIIQAAITYCNLGWHVLPVNGKVPAAGDGWPDKTTNDPTKVKQLFKHADGVGVQLGPKSGIIDVECDSVEAHENLVELLGHEPTGVSFKSARGNHYLYRWSDKWPEKTVFKVNGIEFRIGSLKACQSVFPPSGGRQWIVEPWLEGNEIEDFPALDKLLDIYAQQNKRRPFVATNIAIDPFYGDSETLDVPRWLNKHGIEIIGKHSTDDVMRWYIECPGIDRHTTGNNYRDCCVTQEASGKLGGCCFHQSCGMSDWHSLRSAIGELTHDDFHEPIAVTNDFADFMLDASWSAEPSPKLPDVDPFAMPTSLFEAEGIIQQFIQYAVSTAPRPRPEIALANAIAMVGVITGRKVRNKSGLRTNIYMIGLAESGSGKDWSRKCCREIMGAALMQDYLAAENPASGAALVTAIHDHPSSLFQIDEINRYFASIKGAGSRSPFLNEVFDILMKLNDQCTNPAWSPKGYGESKKNKVVAFPHCCIFGTGTPDGFWGSVKSSDATDGFLARMVVIEAPLKHPRKVDAEHRDPPAEIIERVTEWNNWFGGSGNLKAAIPQVVVIPIDSAAKDRLWTHSEGIEDRLPHESREQRTIWSRTAATAEKLAMIFACSRGPQELLVRIEDAERAVALANWATRLLVRRIFSSVSENEDESKRKRVLAIISEAPIDANTLCRRTQWLRGSRERREVLDDLLESGLIESAFGDKSQNGKARLWYRKKADFEE